MRVTRRLLRASGEEVDVDVELDVTNWNAVIGAETGTPILLGAGEVAWLNEDGLINGSSLNRQASARLGFAVMGDVLIIEPEDLDYRPCEKCHDVVRSDHECLKEKR